MEYVGPECLFVDTLGVYCIPILSGIRVDPLSVFCVDFLSAIVLSDLRLLITSFDLFKHFQIIDNLVKLHNQ